MSAQTFFKRTEHKFTSVELTNGVELNAFLNACRSYLEFYDLFGGTVFAPIKSDVNGNINKLQGEFRPLRPVFFGLGFLKKVVLKLSKKS